MKNLFESTREASIQLALLNTETINQVLNDVADAAIAQTEQILEANAKDLARMDPKNPMYDRLKLT
ncbi:MAG: gamma-glutamyl-phosphate reductase, partial [Bacteroidaceae bacterium]|nr:gamma-glutamyl-phosphate reductase [Bacteroidaceae bacterium]